MDVTQLGTPRGYQLISADPPWLYNLRSAKGEKKSPQAKYPCMPTPEIMAMPVGQLAAKDCLLTMWGTAPMLDQQMRVVEAWGFKFKSMVVWRKIGKSGRPMIGTGFRVRSMAEFVIIATKGSPKQSARFPGIFDGLRRDHSQKPEEWHRILEECTQGLVGRIELFARQRREGWDAFGNDLDRYPMIRKTPMTTPVAYPSNVIPFSTRRRVA